MSHSDFGEATRANVTVAQGLLSSPHLTSGIRKATFRLMPMLIILYFVAFLDRTNVGFAEAALEVDRGISAGAYALGAGIFFIGYALFEIPSNLLLDKFGARFWLARIAVTWGIVASAFAGMGRVERQRKVNAALAEVFASGLHALSIKALAPGEA